MHGARDNRNGGIAAKIRSPLPMSKPEVLLVVPLNAADHVALDRDYVVHRLWLESDQDVFLAEIGSRVRAIITRGDTGASAKLIAAVPNAEMIGCFGVGVDAIDLAAARAGGIKVSNTPDILTEAVADLGLALLLAVTRRIPAGDALVRSGNWKSAGLPLTTQIGGKTLGILGLGRIGLAVAKRAEACGMTIAYCNTSPRQDTRYAYHRTVGDLAAAADVLMITAAATASTRSIVDAGVLAALGPEGYLINIARGSLVDEEALIAALRQGTIAGAGLDVFVNEPAIDERFFTLANAVLLPHVGSATNETRAAMGQLVRDNLAAHFAGKPLLTPVA